jgi:hypothetical protein
VGTAVGFIVGGRDGGRVGFIVGCKEVGNAVGDIDGASEGKVVVGALDGARDGALVGERLRVGERLDCGLRDGAAVEGTELGATDVGLRVGLAVGNSVVGAAVSPVGDPVDPGALVGWEVVGVPVGMPVVGVPVVGVLVGAKVIGAVVEGDREGYAEVGPRVAGALERPDGARVAPDELGEEEVGELEGTSVDTTLGVCEVTLAKALARPALRLDTSELVIGVVTAATTDGRALAVMV